MNVKIDTKEKFVVITSQDTELTAIMTEELVVMLRTYLQKDIPHIILNMSAVKNLDEDGCAILANIQQEFYENGCSFVICALQKDVEEKLDQLELLEILNVTPTESEAWDILQMEEIERELMQGDD
jgi:anti-anti-sigma factor